MKTSRQPTSKSVTDIGLFRRRVELMAAEETARIAARIRERRSELGLTQGELAAKLPGKTDAQQVSKWERAIHRPEQSIEHLAAALDVDISYFYAPEPEDGTPDLMGALSPGPAAPESSSEIDAMRADIRALREDVAQITDVLTQLLAPVHDLLQAQGQIAPQVVEPEAKPSARRRSRGAKRAAS